MYTPPTCSNITFPDDPFLNGWAYEQARFCGGMHAGWFLQHTQSSQLQRCKAEVVFALYLPVHYYQLTNLFRERDIVAQNTGTLAINLHLMWQSIYPSICNGDVELCFFFSSNNRDRYSSGIQVAKLISMWMWLLWTATCTAEDPAKPARTKKTKYTRTSLWHSTLKEKFIVLSEKKKLLIM